MILDPVVLTSTNTTTTAAPFLGGLAQFTAFGTWGASATPQWSPDGDNWLACVGADGVTPITPPTADCIIQVCAAPGYLRWDSSGLSAVTVMIDKVSAASAAGKVPNTN